MTGAVDLSGLKQRAQQPGGGPAPAGGVVVTETNFESDVLVRSTQVPVVVLLWSPRSEACVAMGDALAGLAAGDGGKWVLATINVDAEPRVASLFGVDAVPTVIALAGGQPVTSFQGVQPPEQLRRWIDGLLGATAGKLSGAKDSEPEVIDPALEAAQDLVDAGDFPGAAAAFQAILDKDPNHVEAKGALRQITFLERASIQPPDTLERAEADPDDIEAAFGAADVQILSQDIPGAFDRLIGLIKRTSGDDRTKVRTRLIELFELFDPADPDVIAGRRNLANALY